MQFWGFMTVATKTGTKTLLYQRALALGEVPRYTAGLQVRLKNGERVYLALSALELAFYFEEDLALHYDLEGRLSKVSRPDQYHRRGLSHRALLTRKRTAEEGGGIERQMLTTDAADALVTQAQGMTLSVLAELSDSTVYIEYSKPSPAEALGKILPLLEQVSRFGLEEARRDAEKFHSIYGRVAVLPPDQYNSLVLQATEGCAYSRSEERRVGKECRSRWSPY